MAKEYDHSSLDDKSLTEIEEDIFFSPEGVCVSAFIVCVLYIYAASGGLS